MALELVLPGTTVRPIPLPDGAPVTVGRIPQCDVHIDDQSVSRRHCTIEADGLEAIVKDLGSANGTYVNDEPVTTARLRPGDRLRVGTTTLECRQAVAGPAGESVIIGGDDSTVESVIRRRIDPAQFGWLSSAVPSGQQASMLQRAQRHLSTIHRVSELLAGARDEAQLGEPVLAAVADAIGADRAALLSRQAATIDVTAVHFGPGKPRAFVVSRTIVHDVVERGVSTFAHDATADERFRDGESVIGQRIRSVMCVPLRTTDRILGALYVDSLSGPGRFCEADLELLAAVGNQVGVAMHRVRLLRELEKLLLETIRAIAATVDARDGYTHRHSERVGVVARHLAQELGWSAERQQSAELSALLHDVGKIAVPDAILNKPGRLTDSEYAAIKQHPVLGARILANIQSALIEAIVTGVRHHHERWDGSGYPDGLGGEDIPPLGRLLSVADFYDAMTSTRAYREPMTIADAVALIRTHSGTHFDPAVVTALERLHQRGELASLAAGEERVPRVT